MKDIRNIVALTESGKVINGNVFTNETYFNLSCRWVSFDGKDLYLYLDDVINDCGDIYYLLIEFDNKKVMSMDVRGMKWCGAYLMSSNDTWLDFLKYIRF